MNRAAEFEKYRKAYQQPHYRMGDARKGAIIRYVGDMEPKGSMLDVGTGRGETLWVAESSGFERVRGVEVVPDLIDSERVVYGEVHALPFDSRSFDWVTMFDVMEHLLPGDDEAAVRELCRVARVGVVVTIANWPSFHNGVNLHINLRDYAEWDALLREWAAPFHVERLPPHGSISEAWRLTRAN